MFRSWPLKPKNRCCLTSCPADTLSGLLGKRCRKADMVLLPERLKLAAL